MDKHVRAVLLADGGHFLLVLPSRMELHDIKRRPATDRLLGYFSTISASRNKILTGSNTSVRFRQVAANFLSKGKLAVANGLRFDWTGYGDFNAELGYAEASKTGGLDARPGSE